MLNRNAFMEILVKRFVSASWILAVHPPLIPPLSKLGRRESGEALNAFLKSRRLPQPLTKFVSFLLLAVCASSAPAAVREIGAIGLTVGDLNRELMFYTNTLPFELVSVSEASGPDQDALLGLSSVKLRVAELRLGDERIVLTQHLGNPGRPIPADSRSYDHWFQHIAIVVSDMDEAYEQLRRHKVKQVSTAPQTLPAWNHGAAGIKAFYFRDPEDHVLEIIFFPPGKGDPKWQPRSRRPEEADLVAGRGSSSTLGTRHSTLFLGIDHTAIVVSDTDTSLAFYRGLLGLRVAGDSENYGVEQEHLNQVFGARLHITGLRAEHGPGIEFLEYITPPGGRIIPENAQANDLIFWHTELFVDEFDAFASRLRDHGTRFISARLAQVPENSSNPCSRAIVRDPDGHALEFINCSKSSSSSIAGQINRLGN
jgi:catechol 2,3-dioxygenase-like lactoylglutathione lyase family enzyme